MFARGAYKARNGERRRGIPARDRMAEYAAELDELERELAGEMITLEKQLAFVDAELAKLPEKQEKVLRLRYIEGLTWEIVAEKTGYSERQCRRILKRTKLVSLTLVLIIFK